MDLCLKRYKLRHNLIPLKPSPNQFKFLKGTQIETLQLRRDGPLRKRMWVRVDLPSSSGAFAPKKHLFRKRILNADVRVDLLSASIKVFVSASEETQEDRCKLRRLSFESSNFVSLILPGGRRCGSICHIVLKPADQ